MTTLFDLQPVGLTKLQITYSSNTLQVGGETHALQYTNADEEPGEGVHVEVLVFLDPATGEKADAALITIEPSKSTPVQYWSGRRVYIEAVVEGSGKWIGYSPDGKLVVYDFPEIDELTKSKAIVYGAGWIGSWVAGENGLKIIEVCIPPFESSDTEVLTAESKTAADGTEIPPIFFTTYLQLMARSE